MLIADKYIGAKKIGDRHCHVDPPRVKSSGVRGVDPSTFPPFSPPFPAIFATVSSRHFR